MVATWRCTVGEYLGYNTKYLSHCDLLAILIIFCSQKYLCGDAPSPHRSSNSTCYWRARGCFHPCWSCTCLHSRQLICTIPPIRVRSHLKSAAKSTAKVQILPQINCDMNSAIILQQNTRFSRRFCCKFFVDFAADFKYERTLTLPVSWISHTVAVASPSSSCALRRVRYYYFCTVCFSRYFWLENVFEACADFTVHFFLKGPTLKGTFQPLLAPPINPMNL